MSSRGSVILCSIAIFVSLYLLWRSEKKQAAVGRRYVLAIHVVATALTNYREMQLFLVAYIITSIAEIFSVGGIIDNHTTLLTVYTRRRGCYYMEMKLIDI